MYDELVKELRDSAEWADRLALLMGRAEGDAHAPVMRKAADTIEELQKALDAVNDAHNDGYDVGYWAGRRDYEPKWIPVTERLPEKNGSYLVYAYGEVTEMNCWHGKWHRLGDDYTKAVSHWMPLPEPPKEET